MYRTYFKATIAVFKDTYTDYLVIQCTVPKVSYQSQPDTLTHLLTCPKTKPSLRKMMTEKMERQHGMVTPKIIPSFRSVAAREREGK